MGDVNIHLASLVRHRLVDPSMAAIDPEDVKALTAAELATQATVLNHVIMSPACRELVFRDVVPEDFRNDEAKTAWRRLRDAWENDVDLSSPAIRRMWLVEFGELARSADRSRSWREAANTLVNDALRNRLHGAIAGAAVIATQPDASIQEIREQVEAIVLSSMDDRMWQKPPAIKDIMRSYLDRLEMMREGGKLSPVRIGIEGFDTKFGMYPGEMVVVCARPRVGKTALGLGCLANLARSGSPSGMMCFEMCAEDLLGRLIALESRVPYSKVRENSMTFAQSQQHASAAKRVLKWPIHLYGGPAMAIGDIRRLAEQWVKEDGIKLLCLDYLTLIRAPRSASVQKRYEVVGEISRGLKAMALDLQIPVLVLAQIGRSGANTTPRIEHLRESGDIEQDADSILLIDRPEAEVPERTNHQYLDDRGDEKDMKGKAAIIIGKYRNGEAGVIEIVNYDGPLMEFWEERGNDDQQGGTF